MVLNQVPMGPLSTNAYFYECDEISLLLDPGATTKEMVAHLRERGGRVDAILLTHAHIDHIMGLAGVRQLFPDATIHLHERELQLYQEAERQAAIFGLPFDPLPDDITLFSDKDTSLFSLQILRTPGHSPGSVSFYSEQDGICFSGDTLFKSGVGRTDLWGGSWKQLITSIREKLFLLPEQTRVFCGHGPETTICDEKRSNPFLKGL